MTKVEELKAQLTAAKKERAVEALEKIELIQTSNELLYVQSEQYLVDQVNDKDNSIALGIEAALDRAANKKISRYQEFNYGVHCNALIAAIKVISLQKAEGHQALEIAAHADHKLLHIIEAIHTCNSSIAIEYMGRNSYFDPLTMSIIEGTVGNAEKLHIELSKLSRELGFAILDTSKLTQENMELVELKSQKRATQQLEDQAKGYEESDTTGILQVD